MVKEIGTEIEVFNSSQTVLLPIKKVRGITDFVFRSFSKSKGLPYKFLRLNVVYLTDTDIHVMNREYLGHDYPTDVITFTIEASGEELEGEIYIGAETAARQALEYGVSLTGEVLRLAVHGVLHLLGMDDQTPQDKEKMTQEEDRYLYLFNRGGA